MRLRPASPSRSRAARYVCGLAAGLDRRNGWTIAEHAGEVSPDGMQRRHSGTTGRTENCQIGVFLAYVGVTCHVLIDRESYLPRSWIAPEYSAEFVP